MLSVAPLQLILDDPGMLSATLEGGTFRAAWIDAQNTTDRHPIKTVGELRNIQPPEGGDDWLVWLSSDASQTQGDF
jgi:hypothetical protein